MVLPSTARFMSRLKMHTVLYMYTPLPRRQFVVWKRVCHLGISTQHSFMERLPIMVSKGSLYIEGKVQNIPVPALERCEKDSLNFNPKFGAEEDVLAAYIRIDERQDPSYKY